MPEFPRKDFRLHVGWRTIKTAVSAMLVAIVYCLIGRNPAFACIGVIFGMGVDMQDSIKNGGNRLFDTAIGVISALLVNYFLPRPRVVSLWEGFKGSFRKGSKV
jgi:uncharacterized membrane protein YgaE (UPF0421/DUF939 family)